MPPRPSSCSNSNLAGLALVFVSMTLAVPVLRLTLVLAVFVLVHRGGRAWPPQPATTTTTPVSASALRRGVGILFGRKLERRLARHLEMAALDRNRPVGELPDLGLARTLVERGQDLPVADLAGFGHR